MNDVKKRVQLHDEDTGSEEVQVVLLTEKISQLTDHCQKNPKDFSSKRGMVKMVAKRKKSLLYLQKSKPEKYAVLIEQLELKK